MALSKKEIKDRYFKKKLESAVETPCACGCGTTILSVDEYGRPKRYVSGHNTPRKYTQKGQNKREWNHRNRKARYEYKKRYHLERRSKLIEMFGGVCKDCNIRYDKTNGGIFHFHHIDPSTKLFNIGNQVTVKSWERLVQECSKCVLICANCHELRHSPRY